MEAHHIREARTVLNACGFAHVDRAGLYVPLVKSFVQPCVLQANQTAVFTKELTGDTVWCMRSISCDQGMAAFTGVRLQIQLPSGRFLFGQNGIDVGQFAWVGSYRYWMEEEQDIEPGSKISVTLADTNVGGLVSPLAVNIVFGGFYKYYFEGMEGDEARLASAVPRYQGIVNENILAPAWMAGAGPQTPDGYEDDLFTYSSTVSLIALGGPVSTVLNIPIDNGLDFVIRRVLVDLEPGALVTAGAVLMRLRTGTGYALMDDYIDVARYLAGSEWLGSWTILGNDQVVIDMALVDTVGTGSMSVQIHIEGVKRHRI